MIKNKLLLIVALFFCLGMVATMSAGNAVAGTPHLVLGTIQNSDASVPAAADITFTAYISTRTDDKLTQASPGCSYDGANYGVEAGNFSNPWTAGEIMVIEFVNLTALEAKTVQVTLTNAGLDMSNVTLEAIAPSTLTITPVDPTVQVPNTQQFTATATFTGVSGGQDVTSKATWSSSDTDKGTLNAAGLFTPLHTGSTDVAATLSGVTSDPSTVTVTAGAADSTNSTVTATPTANVTVSDDGSSYSTVTVTIKDVNDNAVSGQTVNITLTGAGNFIDGTDYTVPVDLATQTNGNGQVSFQLSSTAAGTKTVTAAVGGTIMGTVDVAFVADVFSIANSTVSAASATKTTDGGATVAVTVTLKDLFNNPVSGQTVTLEATGTANTIVQPASATDTTGVAAGTIASTKAEAKTITAKVGATTVGTATVTFTAGAAASFQLATDKTTIASNGKGTATITATVLDANDNEVTTDAGRNFTFSVTVSGTYLKVNEAQPVVTATGTATSSVTTQGGTVPVAPTTATVQAVSDLGTKTIDVSIVNFSIDVTSPAAPFYTAATGVHLVTSGSTPKTAAFTGMGGTTYQWALSGGDSGEISATSGSTITYTAPATVTGNSVTDTVTLTDAADGSLTDSVSITVYNPLSVTYPAAAIGIALGDTTYGITAAGATGTYKFQSSDTSVATVDADSGAITPVAVGTFTVQVRDLTYGVFGTVNGFYAVSPAIEIVAPIVVTPATASLAPAGTQTFSATGGKAGGYTWTCSSAAAGSIDSTTGLFTAAAVTATETATITATDGYGITGTATVNVYKTLTITNKPATAPTVLSGATSETFTVSGGDNTLYTWTVTGPAPVAGGTGASYAFVAPSAGDFAGVYTITVTDNQGFTDSFHIKVPIKLTPGTKAFTETKLDGSANPQTLALSGAAGTTYTWEIMDSLTATTEVATPAEYGTWAASGTATEVLTPANVAAVKKFYVRVTVEGDADLTAANSLNQKTFGPFTVIPVDTFTVTVSDSDGNAVNGASVSVDYTDPNTSTKVAAVTSDTSGDAAFILPDAGGTYSYTVTFAGKVSQQISSKSKTVAVTLLAIGDTITGTVEDTVGAPLGGATVTAYLPSDLTKRYETATAGDGTYTINLPLGAASTGWTVMASLNGYKSVSQADQVALTTVDFTGVYGTGTGLQAKTTITGVTATVIGTTVQLDITASPAFSVTTEATVTVASGNGALGPLSFAAGTLSVVYGTVEDFTVVIKADTSEDNDPAVGYSSSYAFSYVAGDTATGSSEGDVDAGSSGTAAVTANSQTATVNVTAGGLTNDATIVIKQVPKTTTSTKTSASLTYVYEVTATDSATGTELTDAEINRVEITIPIDLSVISSGDLESGAFVIYHAASLAQLESTGGTAVPTSNIISTDYVGDGSIGSVTFYVTGLSVFGIGSGGGGLSDDSDDSRCFIATAAYGSPFEKHVRILRKFRDVYLMPNRIGHSFVQAYYSYSPRAAAFIADHETLRAAVRVILLPAVGISYMMVSMGAFWSLMIIAGFGSMLLMLAVGMAKMRRRPSQRSC